MNQRPFVAPNLRQLFLAIARTTLASSWLIACAEEQALLDDGVATSDRDRDEPNGPHDAGTLRVDAGLDAGALPVDAGLDAGRPPAGNDAGLAPDAGQRSDAAANGPWTRVPCPTAGAAPEEPLETPRPLGSVAVYAQSNGQRVAPLPDGGLVHYTSRAASVGAVCGSLPPFDGCSGAQKELINRPCASLPCRFAIISEGGNESRIEARDELLRLLGSIDSAAEAVLLAAFDGYHMCPGIGSDPRDIGTEWRADGDGFELQSTWEMCGVSLDQRLLSVDAAGKVVVVSQEKLKTSSCAIGRRPPGLCAEKSAPDNCETGNFLARSARLEHASIYAFYQLVCELRAHGAPQAMQLMALDAMLDEVRHTREMEGLARDFGSEIEKAEVEQTAMRSLFELALDNAREGCVRETFGALLATYQAASAGDARVQAVMARIAEDETRHATLSWRLMTWLLPRLSERERTEVRAAKAQAEAELLAELELPWPESIRHTLGMPSPQIARGLLRQMSGALPS